MMVKYNDGTNTVYNTIWSGYWMILIVNIYCMFSLCSFQDPSPSLMYAASVLFVNLTNSNDKQDIAPEMVELAKFSKQHVPEEHPKV